jgi:hypothetical protein
VSRRSRRYDEFGGAYGVDTRPDGFPGGFDTFVEPPKPEPYRRPHSPQHYGQQPVPPRQQHRRRGRPLAAAVTAGTALLGAALLITGATQTVQRDQLSGLAMPQPGDNVIAAHEAADPAGVAAAHAAAASTSQAPTTSTVAPSTGAAKAPVVSDNGGGAVRPAQGNQLPNTIRLPKGGSAYLVHVQVTSDGSLPVPDGLGQAVWWGTGLTAAAGATVFAGHVNWAGATGPFAELWDDGVGNVITISDNSGKQWRFRVTQVLTLNKKSLPQQAPALFSATGPHRIVLATCGGEWLASAHTYADNRVLVATPIG